MQAAMYGVGIRRNPPWKAEPGDVSGKAEGTASIKGEAERLC
jgi:hypothetical protein